MEDLERLEDLERIKELAFYLWESMDMKQIEEYVVETLKDRYTKNPIEFEEQWKDYQEADDERTWKDNNG